VKSRSPASSRLSATARHLSRHFGTVHFSGTVIRFG
jgi:hypothetical protein